MRHFAKLAFFFFARALGLFALSRWKTRHHIRIVCYHGGSIGDERLFSPKLFCTANQIYSRLSWLNRADFTPISLDDAVRDIRLGICKVKLPVVITVDDGWHSSRESIISPALEMGYPVTLYVATEVLKHGTPVFDVTINYIIWRAARGVIQVQGLGPIVDGQYDLSNSTSRRDLTSQVLDWLQSLSTRADLAAEALIRFAKIVGVSETDLGLQTRRFHYLSIPELREVAANGCAIELHGHNHRYPVGRPDLLRADIEACRAVLAEIGLPKSVHYCFPSGEFDSHAKFVFEDLGILSGTTCTSGLINVALEPSTVYLPRFLDGSNVSSIEFEAAMSGFDQFVRRLLVKAHPRPW